MAGAEIVAAHGRTVGQIVLRRHVELGSDITSQAGRGRPSRCVSRNRPHATASRHVRGGVEIVDEGGWVTEGAVRTDGRRIPGHAAGDRVPHDACAGRQIGVQEMTGLRDVQRPDVEPLSVFCLRTW